MRRSTISLFTVLVSLLALFASLSHALPLSTHKRWIIDNATGQRTKLMCVNWITHEQTMLAEGLDKQPLSYITSQVVKYGFNCVRFTWAIYMVTRYGNRIVGDTFRKLDLEEAIERISKKNPSILNMTHLQAFDAVIDALGESGVMVSLDNHVSDPKWCCSVDDENGFFGDRHFKPDEWVKGLSFMANRYKGRPHVVAMSLRNELRGPRSSKQDWYKYVRQGATAIHESNPNMLVIISGLNYDSDFTHLKKQPLDYNLDNKLIYEVHLYSFTGQSQKRWTLQPQNRVCATVSEWLTDQAGFLMTGENQTPLFLSEIGYDQTMTNEADVNFITCLLSYAATRDMDFAWWAWQGSYYFREGKVGGYETFAIMDNDWKGLRYPDFPQKFQILLKKIQDPTSNVSSSYLMHHPQTGKCVRSKGKNELVLGDCGKGRWSHDGDGAPIRMMGTATCIKAVGDGLPASLAEDCLSMQSAWKSVSISGLHLATYDENGNLLCLEKDSKANSTRVLTKKCICIEDNSACMDNPQSQWFKLVPINVE